MISSSRKTTMTSMQISHGPIDMTAVRKRASRMPSAARDTLSSSIPEVCKLLGFPIIQDDENLQFQRRRVKAGQWVYATGEPLEGVFAVFAGCLKTMLIDPAGNEQILGFPQKGDLLGMDGVFSGHHASQAIALTDCELVVIPFHEMSKLGTAAMALENWLYRATCRELAREHALVGLLGTLSADARVARFLVSLSERFAEAGYSPRTFHLCMTRKDIGSYLGLTLETASRTLSALHAAGLIAIEQRDVEIKDLAALRSLQRIAPQPAAPIRKDSTAQAQPLTLATSKKAAPTAAANRQPKSTIAAGSIWLGLHYAAA
jgi:CRP/FNR family transcriptional regulator